MVSDGTRSSPVLVLTLVYAGPLARKPSLTNRATLIDAERQIVVERIDAGRSYVGVDGEITVASECANGSPTRRLPCRRVPLGRTLRPHG